MNIGKAFGYVFEDERWVNKLLLGTAISLIPFFGAMALWGYMIAVIRNVMAGETRPLPEWQDLGKFFVDGLMITVVDIIYALPLILLSCVFVIPGILPQLGGDIQSLRTVLSGLSSIMCMGIGCVLFLYTLVLAVLFPVLFVRFAVHGTIASCLQFGQVFRMAIDNIGPVLITQLMVIVGLLILVAVLAVVTLSAFIPVCGWAVALLTTLLMFPLWTWLIFYQGYLYGQFAIVSGSAQAV